MWLVLCAAWCSCVSCFLPEMHEGQRRRCHLIRGNQRYQAHCNVTGLQRLFPSSHIRLLNDALICLDL